MLNTNAFHSFDHKNIVDNYLTVEDSEIIVNSKKIQQVFKRNTKLRNYFSTFELQNKEAKKYMRNKIRFRNVSILSIEKYILNILSIYDDPEPMW
jgi:hypothetical protein